MLKCLVCAILGLLLMAAPGSLGYDDPAASFHHIIGPLIVSFSVIAIWEPVRGSRHLNLPLLLALIVVTPLLNSDIEPIILAFAVGVSGLALSLARNPIKGSYGGGWNALLPKRSH